MNANILTTAQMQEKIAKSEQGNAFNQQRSAISRDEFVDAINSWVTHKRIEDALTKDELASMGAFDRLDVLRKGMILSLSQYYKNHRRADVTLGVLILITIMSDNDTGACGLSQTTISSLFFRTRTTIAEAMTRLKEDGLIHSDKGKSGSHPLIPRVFAAEYNHVVWLIDALKPTKPVGCSRQVDDEKVSGSADKSAKPVGYSRQVDDSCRVEPTPLENSGTKPVGLSRHNFTSVFSNHTYAGAHAREGSGRGDEPEAPITPDQYSRWVDVVSGWGLPVGQQLQTPPDRNAVKIMLKNVVLMRGKKSSFDDVADAVETVLLDMEGLKWDVPNAKAHTGLTSAKRYFESTFSAKLIKTEQEKLEQISRETVLAEKTRIAVDTERQAQAKKMAALDGAINQGADVRAKKFAAKEASAAPAPAMMEGGERELGGLSRDRVVKMISDFFAKKFWSAGTKDALGPPPGYPGCRLSEDLIADGRALAGE